MGQDKLPGQGEELSEINFDGFMDWFIHIGDLSYHWKAQPTYVLVSFSFLFGGICTFIHAMKCGGRLKYLWLGILIHGLVVEVAAYWMPDIDNFWHSQTLITLIGRRLPLHIIFLYPCFLYNASVAVSKLRLPTWAEPFAVGMTTVLIDIPYDISSVKFVHWTWHDTDPNIYDRHYWVPWNSYYFHLCFAASFTFWFHGFRRWFGGTKSSEDKWKAQGCAYELCLTILAGLLGMPGGVLLFLPLYHPLHDIYGIHSEVTFFILLSIAFGIVWSGLSNLPQSAEKTCNLGKSLILLIHLVTHYGVYLVMVLFYNPEDEISIGLHEKVGPCNETEPVQTAFGLVLKKRKYLCPSDYDEKYFDFHCIAKKPNDYASWYTICGTPFENRTEYIAIIAAICLLAFNVFRKMHFYSSSEPDTSSKKSKGSSAQTTKKITSSKKKQ